jgi:tRNA pseudouridine32 synthase/23S rRNA pseudouridine746 synthase
VNAAGLVVVHLDAACVVVDKPSGLLSVPGRGPDKQDCLARRVQATWPETQVVHRLDMGTSGLWLMARSPDMQRAFSRAFEQHTVDKRYVAVVAGRVAPPQSADGWGEIDLPLAADWPRRPLQRIDHARGRPSLTRWRVLEASDDRTRLELAPRTGRTHQLRVHLQAIGHPILGDALYAPPDVQAMAPRLLLHACALRLAHPACGEALALRCPPPF